MPFWNPYIQLGLPFVASLRAGAPYPPSILLLVPFPLGFNLFFPFQYAVAWSGATFWLHGEHLSRAGATAGAQVFAIDGYLVSWVTNMAHLQTAAWRHGSFSSGAASVAGFPKRAVDLNNGAEPRYHR